MVTSTFRTFSVARASVPQVSATAAAGRAPSRSASKTPSLVAVTTARAYTGAYASSIATGTTPDAMTADSSGFSAINPTRIVASSLRVIGWSSGRNSIAGPQRSAVPRAVRVDNGAY